MKMDRTASLNRAAMARRGSRLEYFTIVWNSLEGVVALVAGWMAGSIALVGFGVDSAIEVTSGAALLWRMSADADPEKRERIETATLRIVGVCFVGLAVYVSYEAVVTLIRSTVPERSITGIVLALLSLAIMPLLARAKRRVGAQLQSKAMQADAMQTQFCTY